MAPAIGCDPRSCASALRCLDSTGRNADRKIMEGQTGAILLIGADYAGESLDDPDATIEAQGAKYQ